MRQKKASKYLKVVILAAFCSSAFSHLAFAEQSSKDAVVADQAAPSPAKFTLTYPKMGIVLDVTGVKVPGEQEIEQIVAEVFGFSGLPEILSGIKSSSRICAFNLSTARIAGYTDRQIADFLGGKYGYDTTAARKTGYSDEEILNEISRKVYLVTLREEAPAPAAEQAAPAKEEAPAPAAEQAGPAAYDAEIDDRTLPVSKTYEYMHVDRKIWKEVSTRITKAIFFSKEIHHEPKGVVSTWVKILPNKYGAKDYAGYYTDFENIGEVSYLYQLNCKTRQYKFKETIVHDLSGNVVYSESTTPDSAWKYPLPETFSDDITKAVCGFLQRKHR